MVKFNRIDCLSHPVCVNYLKMKWYIVLHPWTEFLASFEFFFTLLDSVTSETGSRSFTFFKYFMSTELSISLIKYHISKDLKRFPLFLYFSLQNTLRYFGEKGKTFLKFFLKLEKLLDLNSIFRLTCNNTSIVFYYFHFLHHFFFTC